MGNHQTNIQPLRAGKSSVEVPTIETAEKKLEGAVNWSSERSEKSSKLIITREQIERE